MYLAEVRFEVKEESQDDENLISNLTHSWRVNGQVLGREFPVVVTDNVYRLVLMVPRADSLEACHDGQYVTWAKSRLKEEGIQGPFVSILGEEPFSADHCTCAKRSYFILYTTCFDLESPLRCGDCFGPIPRYEISNAEMANGQLFDRLNSWESDYKACDTLQMHCTTGEKFGLREMANHDSSLSRNGREICDTITTAEGIPTYYHLHRYRGRSDASERKRKCPSCGGEWLLTEQLHRLFDFKCDHCRLLSNIALSIQ
jgi:predicted  nucleic acid-binding Zn ribbon protein